MRPIPFLQVMVDGTFASTNTNLPRRPLDSGSSWTLINGYSMEYRLPRAYCFPAAVIIGPNPNPRIMAENTRILIRSAHSRSSTLIAHPASLPLLSCRRSLVSASGWGLPLLVSDQAPGMEIAGGPKVLAASNFSRVSIKGRLGPYNNAFQARKCH